MNEQRRIDRGQDAREKDIVKSMKVVNTGKGVSYLREDKGRTNSMKAIASTDLIERNVTMGLDRRRSTIRVEVTGFVIKNSEIEGVRNEVQLQRTRQTVDPERKLQRKTSLIERDLIQQQLMWSLQTGHEVITDRRGYGKTTVRVMQQRETIQGMFYK
jgi:hypothetical protein